MSHIISDSAKVIRACTAYKAHSEFMRDITKLDVIRQVSHDKQYWLFGNEIGYQKAYDKINSADSFSYMDYWSANWFCGELCDDCNRLILLAKNGDPITISENHAFIFNPKWEKDLTNWGIDYGY